MRMLKFPGLFLAAASVLSFAQVHHPTVAHKPPALPIALDNGKTTPLQGTTSGLAKELAGPVVQDKAYPLQLKGPSGTIQAVLHDRVVKEKTTGTLDFYTWVSVPSNVSASSLTIQRTGFSGAVFVEYRKDGIGTAAPSTAERSGDGSTISFQFQNAALATTSKGATRSCFVKTSATAFAQNGMTTVTLNGAASAPIKTASPH